MLSSTLRRSVRAQSKNLPAFARRAYAVSPSAQALISKSVQDVDPEMADILNQERTRQKNSITLIPSENFTSKAVMDLLGSEMQNKYSEGYPGERYYGGNEIIDKAEALCQKRALEAFGLDPSQWGVNVQPLSGAPANLYAYSAILEVGDRIMGLDLPHGGHLSHGYQTNTTKISYISKYFQTMPYRLNEETGIIDYDTLEKNAQLFRPKVIVAGASAYSRVIDYKRMRQIADKVGAYLLSDMAHISGLVSAGVTDSPFPYSDIVTTTTHKSLRGPRGAMIFFRKGIRKVTKKGKEIPYELERKINFSVFPGHQGGPHNHTISALAVALKQCTEPEYVKYQQEVVSNAKHFADALVSKGFKLVSDGTDTHLILVDLRSRNIDGARVEAVLERANIAANKNTVPGDVSALFPSGLRVGTPAMTTRGFGPEEFDKVAEFIDQAVNIAIELKAQEQGKVPKELLASFKKLADESDKVKQLDKEVVSWVSKYPVPGEL
ncbi:serine hydroxymethyltransferase, mitochondrial [Candida albicans L26]|uniref:Serine hydroxymethyltransferase n=3 Tax=Candida albicans TaxID=5476 RepID=A0A1D8PRB3_CANAL|nr:glycine hydroxymethyltransferase [Candida albicans SC5314]KAF6070518.1 Serine hydroxymethyltransferase, mitochondrial [Candida albicans]KGR04654.1 serine hydroxymethyltransferase, mitochondrial [Candida albicans P78048]KGU03842.1 serine hydroxymethyltransferase, mitochondrial [Candida albicans L26]KGU20196.1 serine hydroxymethyltransferase, mitochondrial [Candida albicans P34048]KGU22868.1 serine hydroxymethyltransferase, mitochondrial [Candida albicans P57055]KHC30354.1 serine hydroxymeth|eukprot:XP_711682.2 glycine hydroxymethyltransferase [Candida albicans SC5314]